jgi:hypothetical protein
MYVTLWAAKRGMDLSSINPPRYQMLTIKGLVLLTYIQGPIDKANNSVVVDPLSQHHRFDHVKDGVGVQLS